jgi:hypothetical protein
MRKMFLILLLVVSSFLMSSCIKVVMRFNPDGSGKLEFGFNMSVQNAQAMSMMTGEEPDSDLGALGELLMSGETLVDEETGIGFSAVERLENGSIWTYMIVEVPTIEAWNEVEAAGDRVLPSEETADVEAEDSSPTSILEVPTITVDGNTIRVELVVPAQGEEGAPPDPTAGIIQMSYEIEMPGTLGAHNGQIDTLTGNPVWLIDMGSAEPLEIKVESTVE